MGKVPDPDLEIRREGRSSRPLDMGRGGGGREQSPKIFFGPFGPQFGLKFRGRGPNPRVSPLDPPLGDYN